MSNTYTFTGRVVHICDVIQVGNKGTDKLAFVVSDEAEKYPQEVMFEAIGKSVVNIERDLELGQQVTVSFDIRGRHWKDDKWFNSLNAWRVEVLGRKPAAKTASDPAQGDLPPLDSEDTLDEEPPF